MRVYRFFLLFCLGSSLLAAQSDTNSSLSPNYWFANVNVNYFDWNNQAEADTNKGDYSYFGVEGGAGWQGVDLYTFLNIENPTHEYKEDSQRDLRFSAFGDLDVSLYKNFKLHFQDFALNSGSYYVNDFIIGFAYKLDTDFGLWFRPFLGVHHTYDSYYKGLNGYMTGWLFNYDFSMFSYKFTLFQWNEIEFGRHKEFYLNSSGESVGDGESWGLNGAISLWMHINKIFTVGLQYRYANNKLGYQDYQAGTIYTIKYNF